MNKIIISLVILNEQEIEGELRYDGFVKLKGKGIKIGPLKFMNVPWAKVILHVNDSTKHIEYVLDKK